MNKQEAIQEWKQLGIKHAEFEFSCGSDSMNDTTLNFFDKDNKIIKDVDDYLHNYIDDEVYKQVTFYEASDGHYQGEAGIVTIELDDSDDDETEHEFTYSKESEAEYNETFTEVADVELTDRQVEFIKLNVSNINGGDDSDITFNYKRDFIMTDKDDEIEKELNELIYDCASNYDFEQSEGESTDWFSFTTNNDKLDELTIEGNILKLEVQRTFIVYQPSDW